MSENDPVKDLFELQPGEREHLTRFLAFMRREGYSKGCDDRFTSWLLYGDRIIEKYMEWLKAGQPDQYTKWPKEGQPG